MRRPHGDGPIQQGKRIDARLVRQLFFLALQLVEPDGDIDTAGEQLLAGIGPVAVLVVAEPAADLGLEEPEGAVVVGELLDVGEDRDGAGLGHAHRRGDEGVAGHDNLIAGADAQAAEGGEEGPSSDTITALSRALLFYAAQARPGSKATDTLRARFRLEELIPDREALLRARGAVTGRDAELFASIGEAVREELAQVKDTLDMELRTGRVDREQREGSKTSLRQLADTLNMLDLPVAAKAVENLLPELEARGLEVITV